ncbi:PAAR domain-containing protein [Pseudomonas sp. TH08]|uniref:PAAR domain-containing protein n=1 Tax=unclassified Pseudomonas TaxID=196821 RepID=UPI00191395AE|nr:MULTISPECIES: PAAR domain-containing protein [unclassified Pseudomonas]MBK5527206.1 PAAR domain-containing protein [Pseudomonas sp. TH06]MBK5531540.1 PAAR domain-containing protein [Pseudomonas sp. TH08]
MSGKPAARVTDPTACPLPGHGTNPIVSGSPDVIFEGLQAARMNDATACGGHIVSGVSSTVFINGQPAAMLGSVTDHGAPVIQGASTIIIGDTHTPAPFIPIPSLPAPFSGRFQLINQETGKPMAGRKVKVWSSSGTSLFDTTDSEGMTCWVKDKSPQTLHIDLVPGESND